MPGGRAGVEHGGSGAGRAHQESASRGADTQQPTRQMTAASAFQQGAARGSHVKEPKPLQILHGLGEGLEADQALPLCFFAV